MTQRVGPSEGDLLLEYSRQPKCRVLEVDGLCTVENTDTRPSDDDGYSMEAGLRWNLLYAGLDAPVRVQILAGAQRSDVLALLKRIRRSLKRDWESLTRMDGSEWQQSAPADDTPKICNPFD